MKYRTEDLCYDPRRDVKEVNQFSGIDLAKAYNENLMPDVVAMDDTRFNNIQEPDSILGKPADIFEATQLKETITTYKAPEKTEE